MKNQQSIGRKMGVRRLGAPLITTLVTLLCLVCPAPATAANDLLSLPAIKSRLAQTSVLMDVFNTGERLVAVGERGHILLSDDDGKSWVQVDVPTSVTLTAVYFPTPEKGWVVGHDGVVLHSADAGQTWVKQLDGTQINEVIKTQVEQMLSAKANELSLVDDPAHREELEYELENLQFFVNDSQMAVEEGPTRPFMDLWFKNEREGIIIGSFGMILKTEDGGQHWQPIMDRIENLDGYHYYAIAPAGDALFIAGERGMLFRSFDDGENWQRLETPYDGSFFGLAGNQDGSLVVVFGLRGNAYVSSDSGASWQAADTPKGSALSGAEFLEDGSLLMVSNDGKLVRSNDKAQTFQKLSATFPGGIDLTATGSDNVVVVGAYGAKSIVLKD
jgi:photosystem II stability/assembly factor-like uncharacterized protein